MTLLDTVKTTLTIEEQNALGDAAIQNAITSAIYRFSLLRPLTNVSICPVSILSEVSLPLDWTQGFSSVEVINFPVITTGGIIQITPPATSFSWNESPKLLFPARSGKSILSMQIYIEEAFDSNTKIFIGDPTNPQRLVSQDLIIPDEISQFEFIINYTYPIDTEIFIWISNATKGYGTVVFTLEP